MYIKSIIIDGFKSYGKRTEVHGFDPEFNAITGLNGTGKSNILDSICFVLGISNLVHVSAFRVFCFHWIPDLTSTVFFFRFAPHPSRSWSTRVARPG